MTRREFLKICAKGIAGIFLIRATSLFNALIRKKDASALRKHPAKFYKETDSLAG